MFVHRQHYTFLYCGKIPLPWFWPCRKPTGHYSTAATCIFPLFHLCLHPWCNVSVPHRPWGYNKTSAVGGIICNLLFCLFYLTSNGIPLLSKSNNYLNLDVKTLSIIIRAPFAPTFPLMPVVTMQEPSPWVFFSLAELSGCINRRIKSVPGDRNTLCDLRI